MKLSFYCVLVSHTQSLTKVVWMMVKTVLVGDDPWGLAASAIVGPEWSG